MTYPYDPQLAEVLPTLPALDFNDIEATRALLRKARAARSTGSLPPTVTLTACEAPAAGGASVAVQVFAPEKRNLAPVLLWFHGGGFVIGDALMDSALNALMADELGIVVASVEYSLAPEAQYPTQVEQGYAALEWLVSSSEELGIDPERISVGGQSAGACIAAALTHIVRDRGGPRLVFQVLDIPVTDDRLSTPSMLEYDDTPYWTKSDSVIGWNAYLGDQDPDLAAYAAPARAADLHGLPPAFISVSQFDPLRDEGIDYAQRLAQANVPTELHLYPGTFHGSTVVAAADVSQRMKADLLTGIARGMAVHPEASASVKEGNA